MCIAVGPSVTWACCFSVVTTKVMTSAYFPEHSNAIQVAIENVKATGVNTSSVHAMLDVAEAVAQRTTCDDISKVRTEPLIFGIPGVAMAKCAAFKKLADDVPLSLRGPLVAAVEAAVEAAVKDLCALESVMFEAY